MENGTGGIDWSGLPLMVEMLGVDDVEMLVHRLYVIKLFKPETTEGDSPTPEEDASA